MISSNIQSLNYNAGYGLVKDELCKARKDFFVGGCDLIDIEASGFLPARLPAALQHGFVLKKRTERSLESLMIAGFE
jgi:hypothetical protein